VRVRGFPRREEEATTTEDRTPLPCKPAARCRKNRPRQPFHSVLRHRRRCRRLCRRHRRRRRRRRRCRRHICHPILDF